MLSKKYRLSRKDASSLRQFGQRAATPDLQLVYSHTTQKNFSRWLISVPKKNTPKAVVRNRSKRMLNEAIKELLFDFKTPIEGILVVKKPIFNLKTKEVKQKLTAFFKTVKLI